MYPTKNKKRIDKKRCSGRVLKSVSQAVQEHLIPFTSLLHFYITSSYLSTLLLRHYVVKKKIVVFIL